MLELLTTLLTGTVVALLATVVRTDYACGADGPVRSLAATDLRCEYAADPLGIDVTRPRLFWKLHSGERGQRQTAYRILVASNEQRLARDEGDLWDSGRVGSEETTQIRYGGRRLNSSQQVFWKVCVWDRVGRLAAWSEAASWTMGLLGADDWQARWITAAENDATGNDATGSPTLRIRREFAAKPGLRRALVHVSGLGQYELSINGDKVGDDVLAPGWTKYDRTCLYDTRDVTQLVHEGDNAIGLTLAGGMYRVVGGRYTKFTGSFGPLQAILQVRLEYADGTVETIGSDGEWRTNPGPISFSCVYGGEDYDARLDQPGWDQPGFDDRGWTPATETEGPEGELKGFSAAAPPIRLFDVLKPIDRNDISDHVTVYDLGQNTALVPRIVVRGPAGSVVRITPAELAKHDGTADRDSSQRGDSTAYWQYTLAGRGHEEWLPTFTYQGCRYLQVETFPAKEGDNSEPPVIESIEGVVIHSESAPVGQFECSNELFNRTRTLVRWAQRSNMMSVLTDCPHREKLGWLEQYHLNGPSLRYEFDLAQLYTKGVSDMADSQLENGLVPDIAPEYTVFQEGFRYSPEWGSALVIVPWAVRRWRRR